MAKDKPLEVEAAFQAGTVTEVFEAAFQPIQPETAEDDEATTRRGRLRKVMANQDDEVDLEKAILFAGSAQGIYIPQYFARVIRRERVTGVSDEDYNVLTAGPDHEHYWEAWADVIDNAKVNVPTDDLKGSKGEHYLYQHDGDLWLVPVPPPPPTIIMGHEFNPMTQDDWYGYAGAEPGTLICHKGDTEFLALPGSGIVHEYIHDDEGRCAAYEWRQMELMVEPDYTGRKY